MSLPDRQVEILLQLVTRAGCVVSKQVLIEAAWPGVAVTDNSLEQAISALRRTLGPAPGGLRYIETLARRGYRCGVPVTAAAPRHRDDELQTMLARHEAFIDGRTALETLDPEAARRASIVFDDIVRALPEYAPAHLGLANALALLIESRRAEAVRDRTILARARHHALEACRLDPGSGEAWAALALVWHQSRDGARGVAALRRAIALEPDNWRHHLRLAYVGWGEERLRAADRVLRLVPQSPFAFWLAGTVHVARQSLAEAERALVSGCEAQDRQPAGTPFAAVGLHLLLGLIRLAQGDAESAELEFARELAIDQAAHIYAREASACSWSAIGAIRRCAGQVEAASEAFDRALEAVPGYPAVLAARAATGSDVDARAALHRQLAALRADGAFVDAEVAEAVYESGTGRPERAAARVHAALAAAPPGSAAWSLPVDPLLQVTAQPALWEPALSVLRSRAL